MQEPPSDCLNCGVCCFSKSSTYVPVTGDDWTRLGDEPERWSRFSGQRAYMRMEDGHCIALMPSTPRGGPPVFHCSIYDRRPQVCRDLARGSLQCHGELALKGDQVHGSERRRRR